MKVKVLIVDDCTSNVRLLKKCFNTDKLDGIVLGPQRVNDNKPLTIKVTNLLHDLGIPSNIKGYSYIRSAILMVHDNPNFVGNITNGLYSDLSIRFNTSSVRVERAIRHAIEVSWNRGDLDLIDRLFGHSIAIEKSKPTNSEFIVTIADRIRIE